MKGNKLSKTHGLSDSATYTSWDCMIDRCYNKKHKSYVYYGGRGIVVAASWLKFEGFLKDMGEKPSKKHQIGRTNNDGNYCKENCKWETPMQNCNNKSNNVRIFYKGVSKTISEWSRELGMSNGSFRYRLANWDSLEKIIETKRKIS